MSGRMVRMGFAALALLVAVLGWPVPGLATSITVEGLTFSDEHGGFRLVSVTGTGRLGDPFVVVEEVTGPDSAILFVRGLTWRFGNRVDSHHLVGFALTKIAINRTESIWYEYELELREHLRLHSPFGDGLSFGQASPAGRPFTSSKFRSNYEKHEPYDSIIFSDGAVNPGESAVFNVVVTDTTPDPHFYLMQRREQQIVRGSGGTHVVAVLSNPGEVGHVTQNGLPVPPSAHPREGGELEAGTTRTVSSRFPLSRE